MGRNRDDDRRPSQPKPGKCPVCHGHRMIMNEDKGRMETCDWCRGTGKDS